MILTGFAPATKTTKETLQLMVQAIVESFTKNHVDKTDINLHTIAGLWNKLKLVITNSISCG